MSFNSRESAEWALGVDAEAEKLLNAADKALADGAARGFPSPPGDTLASLLAIGQDSKGKLAELDGKIHDTRRGVLFQEQEFALNVLVKLAKLAMELYRAEIFDVLAIEEEQVKSLRETSRADVERRNAETERRQVAIIQNRAEAERRIIVYRQQLVAEETTTLTAEAILINAQLATAEKKLEIIASIYLVLAAEQLVLAAEQRRAVSLSKVLAAELIVAGIKKEMVPFYIEKAEAREALAAAIIAEIPITEAIIRLGYDRIDLKTTEEYAGHLEREQQEELELLREQFIRANTAMELTKLQNHRLLLEYRNTVQAQILDQRKILQEDEVAFRLATGLAREKIGVDNEVAVTRHEIINLTQELVSLLANMESRAHDQADTVHASAFTKTSISRLSAAIARRIVAG
jgi:hypothetical protein